MDRRDFLKLISAGGAALAAKRGGALDALAAEAPAQPIDTSAAAKLLAEHRIAKVESRSFPDVWPRSVGPNSKGNPAGAGGTCPARIFTTDKGVVGWSMAGGAKDEEAQKVVGMRVSDLFDVEKGLAPDASWWLDRLMHDLAANILKQPVWRMIGAAGPREVPVYSSSIYFEDLFPQNKPRGVAGLVDCCRQDFDAGWRAFKLKMGRGFKWMQPRADGLKRDIEVTRAVRERFPDCKVLVDANDGWTADEACEYVKAVADCDLYWIEEPFDENRDDYRRLHEAMDKAGSKAMIADGETRKDRANPPTAYGGYTQAFVDRLYALAAEKLVNVFILDLDIVGFSRWRRVMPDLVKAGVQASPHTWMWTPRTYYAAQLAAGAGNVCIVEGIPGKAKGVDYSAWVMKDGKLVAPDASGFGLAIVEKAQGG